MTKILEFKDKIRNFCNRFEVYLTPILKAVVAFALIYFIQKDLGYNTKFSNILVTGVLALLCAILPANMVVVFSAAVVLMHMYSLSMSAFIFVLAVFVVLFVLYFRLSPSKGIYTALTPLALMFNIPYVIPISIGLLDDDPSACFSVVAGGISYYVVRDIRVNAVAISTMTEEDSIITKFIEVVNQIVADKEMIFMVGLLTIASLLVWLIRRLRVDYAWIIAISFGAVAQFVGRFIIGSNLHIGTDLVQLIIGIVVAVVIGLILQFFFFNLDYERTERVQFEDEEYYYYVKAVPKRVVTSTSKTVKRFNSHSEEDIEPGEARRRLAKEMEIENELLDFKNVGESEEQ